MSKCKCSMSISVLGDGCRYCQPQEQIDRLADALAEETAKADHAEELSKALAESLSMLIKLYDDFSIRGNIRQHFQIAHLKELYQPLHNYREATE